MPSHSSASALPVGVSAALSSCQSQRSIFSQFSLAGKIALVTGGQRGIGLEVALGFAEAGATVYCIDLPQDPDGDFIAAQGFAASLPEVNADTRNGSLQYIQGDVTNQEQMWAIAEIIVAKEGRLDVCFANAGIFADGDSDCLEYPVAEFTKIMNVNVDGILYTAQAAGKQMVKLGIKGSIIMTASMSGSIANENHQWVAYNTSKSAVLQMARSMACELGSKGIRVNTLSPGYIYTKSMKTFMETRPDIMVKRCAQNPLGRIGRPEELRGTCLWLASDASTFCTGSDIVVDGGHRAW